MERMSRSRLRGWWKAIVLVFSLSQYVASYVVLRIAKGEPSEAGRALWLHRCCKLVLRRLGFGLCVPGELPHCGLIASNHLSYLDILFYGATLPCVFVAKAEVRSWPMLGLLASLGGTVFLDRESASSAAEAARRMQDLLNSGVMVHVFPEGTSSDGSSVLKFYPSLFEPAIRAEVPVTAAAIRYSAGGGAAEEDLCYYGDISFAPHLLSTLQLPEVEATLCFASPGRTFDNRKEAAAQAREEVAAMRGGGGPIASGEASTI
jgi:lyso-ornithine lipid O-acyltransferase